MKEKECPIKMCDNEWMGYKWDMITNFDEKTYSLKNISLKSKERFSYGIYTLECILPKGRNYFPSFSLFNDRILAAIDVFVGHSNIFGGYWKPFIKPYKPLLQQGYSIESDIYCETPEKIIDIGETGVEKNILHNPSSEVNKYSLEWTQNYILIRYNDEIVKYVDERTNFELFRYLNQDPYMYVIFSTDKIKNGVTYALKKFDYKKL